MEGEVITAPPAEGVSGQTPDSQGTPTSPQGTPEPQEAGSTQGREPNNPIPSSNGETRSKPSDYYRERQQSKRRIESLERTIHELTQKFDSLNKQTLPVSTTAVQQSKFNAEKFWNSPDEILSEREKALREEIKAEIRKEILGEDIPRVLSERDRKTVQERTMQEGLELIFPKSGIDDKRELADRIVAAPSRMEQVQKILEEFKLNELSENHPKEAAMLVLQILKEQQKASTPAKNPNAIKKALIGSTATGSPISAGGKVMPTLQEIKSQLAALDEQVNKNPDFRYEDSYKTKRKELVSQLSVLAKEQGKNQ